MWKHSILIGLLLAGALSAVEPAVTFNKEVLPILQRKCQSCHRTGSIAPMSFLSYQESRPWAKAMKTAVLVRKMPPWFAAEHSISDFGVATECGMARLRTPELVRRLLSVHAEVSAEPPLGAASSG